MSLVVIKAARVRRPVPSQPIGPVGGLLDPRFVYVPGVATNIARTFRRVRAERAKGLRL